MSDLKSYLLGDYRETMDYVNRISRKGLSDFPPLIITCAITGGLHGKEANMNLPETPEEQVQQTYDAYNAGASMVHIHRRQPENLSLMSNKAEEFIEINAMIREKCPDIIINNTCLGGRLISEETWTAGDQLLASIPAKPEVASLDISNFTVNLKQPARKPPLTGRDEDSIWRFNYMLTQDDGVKAVTAMVENGIKPEFEMFDVGDVKYLNSFIKKGLVKGPYWIQMLFNGNGTLPTADMMLAATRALPKESLFSVIGIGAAQFPIITLAMILGHHVRVGLEDNVYYAPGEPAISNAQMVERVVRIAKELGRPIATPAQAREMMGLGSPRQYALNK